MIRFYNEQGEVLSSYNTGDFDLAYELATRVDGITSPIALRDLTGNEEDEEVVAEILDRLHDAGLWAIESEDTVILIGVEGMSTPFMSFDVWDEVDVWLSNVVE